jgi:hypothetical protein
MSARAPFRVGLFAVGLLCAASIAQAAQPTVAIGASVPRYCKIGARAVSIDVPIVITVDTNGVASLVTPKISIPGVICNASARVVTTSRQSGAKAAGATVAYVATISFGGAEAILDSARSSNAMTTTAQATKGTLTISIAPLEPQAVGRTAADYTDTLHLVLTAQ